MLSGSSSGFNYHLAESGYKTVAKITWKKRPSRMPAGNWIEFSGKIEIKFSKVP
jgi:hypothetical protein